MSLMAAPMLNGSLQYILAPMQAYLALSLSIKENHFSIRNFFHNFSIYFLSITGNSNISNIG